MTARIFLPMRVLDIARRPVKKAKVRLLREDGDRKPFVNLSYKF